MGDAERSGKDFVVSGCVDESGDVEVKEETVLWSDWFG